MNLDCLLCGISGPQVRPVLVEWLEPNPTRFSVIPRCTDRAECRARVKAEGEPWPLAEVSNEAEVTA